MPDPRVIPLRRKLLHGLVTIAILLGITEGAWRLFATLRLRGLEEQIGRRNAFFVDDEACQYLLRPGDWAWDTPPDGGPPYRFHVNALNLRGPEISTDKPDGTFRILCLGGSTTFGSGCVDDARTYPAHLGWLLRKRRSRLPTEVLNGGVPGFRTTESYFNLKRLLPLEPDLVIVYHAINDISGSEKLGEFYFDPDSHRRPLSRLERRRRDASSTFVSALYDRLAREPSFSPRRRASIPPRFVEGFRSNLRRIVETAREHGADVLLLTFATRLDPSWGPQEIEALRAQDAFRVTGLEHRALETTLASYNEATRTVARELGVRLVEIEGRVPKTPDHWSDFVHMNERGSAAMADLLVKPTAEILRTRRKKTLQGAAQPGDPREGRK